MLETLPKFWFVSCVDSLLTIGDRHRRKLAATFNKAKSATSKRGNGCFLCGVPKYVWVLINAMWLLQSKCVPIFMGYLLSRFYGTTYTGIIHTIDFVNNNNVTFDYPNHVT